MTYKIELTKNVPSVVQLSVDYRQIVVFIHYNDTMDNWTIDFYEQTTEGKKPLVAGVALMAGLNLFEGREYLGLGKFIMLPTKMRDGIVVEPDAGNIHNSFEIIWEV